MWAASAAASNLGVSLTKRYRNSAFQLLASQDVKGFAEQARQASLYRTGEITAPGVLECSECGEELHFEKTGRIPPCPKCSATRFQRKSTKPSG